VARDCAGRWRLAKSAAWISALAGVASASLAAETSSPAQDESAPSATSASEPVKSPPTSETEVGEVVITATRAPRPIRDVPTPVTVLPRSEIARSPSQTLDELLRIIPSFATFRRTSSLVSDPTAQGVNLRGVGPSGVSRTLVLIDGLPANDSYGGWFYWRSIPRLGIERIEVAPGGGSALYGNYALGGVVQILSRPIDQAELDADGSLGLPRQGSATARGAGRLGNFGVAIEGEAFSTAGYPVVAPSQRGAIDKDAPSDHQTVNATVDWKALENLTLVSKLGYFAEDQNGGTQYTTASVSSFGYSLGARSAGPSWGSIEATFFGHVESFKQNRARTTADRSSEALAASQSVPVDDEGLAVIWRSAQLNWAGTHRASGGMELRRIYGTASEDDFPAVPTPTSVLHRESRGEQRLLGVFAEDSYEPLSALELVGALRFDLWKNLHARQLTMDATSTTETALADRSDQQLSPKLGVRYRPLEWLTLRASGYGAFRAPTLNELYRPFQVGTILTAANSELGPETLWGGEGGLEVAPTAASNIRANAFWNDLRNPIVNVTLPAPLPDGSQRQRQNVGRARIRGFELEALWRIGSAWSTSAAYTFVDSAVTDFPSNPQLVGKQLAQDPRHRGTVSIAFEDPRYLTATLQARVVGPQFEDDQNLLPMPGFLVVGLFASRRLFSGFDAYAAAENLFNRTYLVGRAGVDTIGQPFTIRIGLRARIDH